MSEPAKRLGPYEVGQEIGGGGMAVVYLGRKIDSDGVEHLVALKVIKEELVNDSTYVNMFLDEANILTRLSHPNIIETHEYGLTGAHRYIAMELLLGRSLSELWQANEARGEVMPAELAAWVCARIADGLHYAHELKNEKGEPFSLVHRDVNPTNIFLTFDGRVKLIDFGLAKTIGRKAKSAEGIVKGKVPYFSPEQVTEKALDRRSDIFTLGATLWEMTTGKRLFKRENDVDTIRAIMKGTIPDPATIVPGYPPELSTIIKKALQTDRDERYTEAGELAKDLDAFLESRGAVDMALRLEPFIFGLFPGDRNQRGKLTKDSTARWLAQGLKKRRDW
ncbi:MAG: serine/threonine-protein kinase [Polyangiaceae bacterium]